MTKHRENREIIRWAVFGFIMLVVAPLYVYVAKPVAAWMGVSLP